MPTEQQSWWRRWLIRPTLTISGGAALLALFGWFWWLGVPALYRYAAEGPGAENARLNAITTIRAALPRSRVRDTVRHQVATGR